MAIVYKIFPAIGVARIGNSDADYFLGPESPGIAPSGPYRDKTPEKKIKPQAVRFRVYQFERDKFGKETCIREVTLKKGTSIEWSIQLVNRKAAGGIFPPGGSTATPRNRDYDRSGLVIDSLPQSISGKLSCAKELSGEINFIKNGNIEGNARVKLAKISTDSKGRLLVIGGPGESRSPLNSSLYGFANNDGWYDSVSDGPVTATIKMDGAEPVIAEGGAWVLVAPPSYAPEIDNVVTWYDQALNVVARDFTPQLMSRVPSFTADIFPILKRTYLLSWVLKGGQRYHGGAGNFLDPSRINAMADNSDASRSARERVFNKLVPPNTSAPRSEVLPDPPKNMPRLYSGVDPDDPSRYEYAALTALQYTMMKRWAEGNFVADWDGEPNFVEIKKLPLDMQPAALTRAALEACIGGPFYPGIEATYLIAQRETYIEPFRIDPRHPAGFLTERMALPWQADFEECGDFWWPAQRPVEVTAGDGNRVPFSRGVNGKSDMVKWWTELGFIVRKGTKYVESERQPIPPEPINGDS